jgi:hypothetical protein
MALSSDSTSALLVVVFLTWLGRCSGVLFRDAIEVTQ